jgi:Chaperone of endosialidase
MKNQNILLTTIIFMLGSFALPQRTQAVVPAPDGGYPRFNTAEGQNALFSLTTGQWNTALGAFTLRGDTDGSYNTAVGTATLFSNVGNQNTGSGIENTAVGAAALLLNTTGSNNTGVGADALLNNTQGVQNTATGSVTLFNNIGSNNTANGYAALNFNFTGNQNTAVGYQALHSNTQGSINTALGVNAGSDLTTGDNNIDIGANVNGVAAESNTIRIGNTDITDTFIRGISGATASGGAAVFVNGNGKLGTMTSSARFKDEIKPIGKASEVILTLKPVTFRYKKGIDPQQIAQFGLVAEEVEKVSPDLVIRDVDGRPQTVRYEQINAMLLNEFLKAHRKIQEQEATITQLKKEMEAVVAHAEEQDSRIQKVSDQIGINKARPRVVRNDLQRKESNTTPQ